MPVVEYNKPLPRPNIDTREYWAGCHCHELVVQQCTDCGTFRFYPCPVCHKCQSENAQWRKVSGRGTVYTWGVVRRAPNPTWKDAVPYAIVVVELAEQAGLLMPGNLVDCAFEDIKAGMQVEVKFVDINDEITLPQWRPVQSDKKS